MYGRSAKKVAFFLPFFLPFYLSFSCLSLTLSSSLALHGSGETINDGGRIGHGSSDE